VEVKPRNLTDKIINKAPAAAGKRIRRFINIETTAMRNYVGKAIVLMVTY